MKVRHQGDSSDCKIHWAVGADDWGRKGECQPGRMGLQLSWGTWQVNYGRFCRLCGSPPFVVCSSDLREWHYCYCDKVLFVSIWVSLAWNRCVDLGLVRISLRSQIEGLLAVPGPGVHFCLSHIMLKTFWINSNYSWDIPRKKQGFWVFREHCKIHLDWPSVPTRDSGAE